MTKLVLLGVNAVNKNLFLASFAFLVLVGCGKNEPIAPVGRGGSKIIPVALLDELPSQYASFPKMNGGACGFSQPKVEGELKVVSGWSVISAKEGVLAETVVLGIASKGRERFAPVTKQKREDVVKFFNSAGLLESGFSAHVATIDVPDGAVLAIYQVFQGKVIKCENVKVF